MATSTTHGLVRVVLADDTADFRFLLRLALEAQDGFVVVAEAGNGVEAIDAVTLTDPDVVLLDLAMPTMDGLEALPRVRAVCPRALIVVLSGFEGQRLAQQAISAGADAYLRKGLSPAALIEQLRVLHLGTAQSQPEFRMPTTDASPLPTSGILPALTRLPDPPWLVDWVVSGPVGVMEVHRGRDSSTMRDPGYVITWANTTALRRLTPMYEEVATLPCALRAVSVEIDELLSGQAERLPVGETMAFAISIAETTVDVWLTGTESSTVVTFLTSGSADSADRLRNVLAKALHEVRNPALLLFGVSEALMRGRGHLDQETEQRLLTALRRQCALLDQATSDLLTDFQQHRGDLVVELSDLTLLPVLQAAVVAQPDAGAVAIRCDPDVRVRADGRRLEQILANLLSNAVKYGGPPFDIDVSRDGAMVRTTVRDTGSGVAPEFVDRLFDEFTRAGGRSVSGTGLGLHIARSLAIAQGGTIEYSDVDGGGAAFTLVLPDANPPGVVAEQDA